MKMTEAEKRMLENLEAARSASEGGNHTIAMGNGKEIVWFLERADDSDSCYYPLKACGYWMVNQFIDGQPVGIGI